MGYNNFFRDLSKKLFSYLMLTSIEPQFVHLAQLDEIYLFQH